MNRYSPCPCNSQLNYKDCCRPYHLGAVPDTAEKLMRSRYCAYVLDMPDYLMATTHPKNEHYSEDKAAWKEGLSGFSKNTQFKSLEIVAAEQSDTTATVTFRANLMQSLADASFTEKSTFEKLDGRWMYLAGDVIEGEKN